MSSSSGSSTVAPEPIARSPARSPPKVTEAMLNPEYLSWEHNGLDRRKHTTILVYFVETGNPTIRYGLDLSSRSEIALENLSAEEGKLLIAQWQNLDELKRSIAALKPRHSFPEHLQNDKKLPRNPGDPVWVLGNLYYHISQRPHIGDNTPISDDYYNYFIRRHKYFTGKDKPNPKVLKSPWNEERFRHYSRLNALTNDEDFEVFMSYLVRDDPTNPGRFDNIRRRNQRGTIKTKAKSEEEPDKLKSNEVSHTREPGRVSDESESDEVSIKSEPDEVSIMSESDEASVKTELGETQETSTDWTNYELELRVVIEEFRNYPTAVDIVRGRPRPVAVLLEELREANIAEDNKKRSKELADDEKKVKQEADSESDIDALVDSSDTC